MWRIIGPLLSDVAAVLPLLPEAPPIDREQKSRMLCPGSSKGGCLGHEAVGRRKSKFGGAVEFD